jgi:hypothetical protein
MFNISESLKFAVMHLLMMKYYIPSLGILYGMYPKLNFIDSEKFD